MASGYFVGGVVCYRVKHVDGYNYSDKSKVLVTYVGFLFLANILFLTSLSEKATSQLLLEPDWDSILQICDSIRQGDVQ